MIKIITYLIFLIFFNSLFCQKDEIGNRIILNSGNIKNSKYHVYKPPFKAKAIYKNKNEALNLYPEQLMSSILSASNQEWVDYNTLGGSNESDKKGQEHFNKVKTINIDQKYFELQSKLEFIANNFQMAIVKFYYHQPNKKPIAGSIVMQKQEDIWKTTSTPYTTKIAMALMVFKPEIFGRILLGEGINEMEYALINDVTDNNGFSFNKLMKRKLSEIEKNYFTNPLNWK
ncbi:hypothetical protein NBT05_12840 [Aquimarina sp. ERC-38]|uniref:hypothetical protein n=1 Tax=Aquimarina sp. ERC-38 TaxID=2949996 RepID=UPI00224764A2|nr:hypothetical protein [Aquimarina sp. ERC-38]UZO79836.1 hypothetical protein NBT05_12840 [Aquimarina sp. ERC-38]